MQVCRIDEGFLSIVNVFTGKNGNIRAISVV